MGFMGGIFKALGFESETKMKIKKNRQPKASFKLKNGRSERLEQIDGIPVYYPESIEQVKEFCAFVKSKKAIIVSIEACEKENAEKILEFLKGFSFGSNSKLILLNEEKLYLILPEGMEVEE